MPTAEVVVRESDMILYIGHTRKWVAFAGRTIDARGILSSTQVPITTLCFNRWAALTLLFCHPSVKREKNLLSKFLFHFFPVTQLLPPQLLPSKPSDKLHLSHPPITPLITMTSSLRMAAPKMASMAAQSSVKVARSPMMKSQQLSKFTRAYSGELQWHRNHTAKSFG